MRIRINEHGALREEFFQEGLLIAVWSGEVSLYRLLNADIPLLAPCIRRTVRLTDTAEYVLVFSQAPVLEGAVRALSAFPGRTVLEITAGDGRLDVTI